MRRGFFSKIRRPLLVMLFALVMSVPVMASEGGDDPANSQLGWIFRWINFAIVFAALVYVFGKLLAPKFRGQTAKIGAAIADAGQAREAAEERLREAEARLAGLETEVAQLRVASQRDAAAERERIRGTAKAEAEKIERAAQAEIAAAERAATQELRSLAARLAVERAEAALRQQMTPQADAALMQSFVKSLEGMPA